MQSIGGNARNIDARYRTLLILWFAFLMSVGFLIVLTLIILDPQHPRSDTTVLSWALCAVGTLLAVISILPKQYMVEQAAAKQVAQLVITGYIIALALAEAAGLFALLLYMLTPGRAYIFMFVISVVAMLAHFPRRTHLLAASYKNHSSSDQ